MHVLCAGPVASVYNRRTCTYPPALQPHSSRIGPTIPSSFLVLVDTLRYFLSGTTQDLGAYSTSIVIAEGSLSLPAVYPHPPCRPVLASTHIHTQDSYIHTARCIHHTHNSYPHNTQHGFHIICNSLAYSPE